MYRKDGNGDEQMANKINAKASKILLYKVLDVVVTEMVVANVSRPENGHVVPKKKRKKKKPKSTTNKIYCSSQM